MSTRKLMLGNITLYIYCIKWVISPPHSSSLIAKFDPELGLLSVWSFASFHVLMFFSRFWCELMCVYIYIVPRHDNHRFCYPEIGPPYESIVTLTKIKAATKDKYMYPLLPTENCWQATAYWQLFFCHPVTFISHLSLHQSYFNDSDRNSSRCFLIF